MRQMTLVDYSKFANNFISDQFLPKGKDEYYLRNIQNPKKNYRHLHFDEVEQLIKNGNSCSDWNTFFVEDPFYPELIKNSNFSGLIRISKLEHKFLQYHDFIVPVGITNSRIISSDILENCAIHDCSYISHYIIGERVILSCINELTSTNHAKFGEGIIKDGEDEKVRIYIDVLNEAGGREVFPFVNMIPADAYLWARYRDDKKLITTFKKITQNSVDSRRGYYGTIGNECCIKSCRIIKDVRFGDAVYVKGANKLKNLTVNSSHEEPTQIGEGVELINGVIGLGSRIFYGVKAVRFVIGTNCELKYGARLIHSILGDNSTISCCEVLNALIFPFHEQHHNNSFLVAALIEGQSNMAAGATVGSNHNTRGPDGELIAGRGFWPGLCTTLKHNSRFAPFVLISKGNYKYELNITLPFSLIINNDHKDELEVMGAYYWMHNMYSLERNNKKFSKRDRRITKTQIIQTDYLAPDTVSSIIDAMQIVRKSCEKAWYEATKTKLDIQEIVTQHIDEARKLTVYCNDEKLERSKRNIRLLKPFDSWIAYRQMIIWYAIKTLCSYFDSTGKTIKDMSIESENKHWFRWENIGGQLIHESDVQTLRKNITTYKLKTWADIHNEYAKIHENYLHHNAKTAYASLLLITGEKKIGVSVWNNLVNEAIDICDYIAEQIYKTKNKDYIDVFRGITYRNKKEQVAVLSTVDKNEIVMNAKPEAENRKTLLRKYIIKKKS